MWLLKEAREYESGIRSRRELNEIVNNIVLVKKT